MLAIIYAGDASPPRSIEIVGSSQQPMVGGPGGGEVKTSPLYNAIYNILAMGSIVASLIILIIALLSIRRLGLPSGLGGSQLILFNSLII